MVKCVVPCLASLRLKINGTRLICHEVVCDTGIVQVCAQLRQVAPAPCVMLLSQ
jgi:hypothetical protein